MTDRSSRVSIRYASQDEPVTKRIRELSKGNYFYYNKHLYLKTGGGAGCSVNLATGSDTYFTADAYAQLVDVSITYTMA